MAAHSAAQDVLALLKDYKIINIDFYEFIYMYKVGL